MCGIIGYIGCREALPLLLNGLEKLEYRGYDSAGISVVCKDKLCTVKRKGRISELRKAKELTKIKGSIGIAHTRWATHGAPNKINAHPHVDCKGEIAIVHNGIIENYVVLKKLLEAEGHKFVSETDSEVLAHLVEKFYSGKLEDAVINALKLVEGTFGVVVIHKKEEKIVAARRSSPLIIGVGKKEMFVASDVSAILKHTKKVIYLNDGEVAVVKKDSYAIKTLNGKKVDKKIHKIKWTVSQIEKKQFKHFMLKEIFEQPEAIQNTLRGRLRSNRVKLTLHIDARKIGRIIIVACGTSWHSALIGKHIIEGFTKIPVEVDYASEFRYRNPVLSSNDLVVVISQSGETADTLAALRKAREKGVKTIGIINVVGSTIAREVDFGIYLHAGPEVGVASTKAFTCQITALVLLALFFRQCKGIKTSRELFQELKNIPLKVKEALKEEKNVRKIANRFKNSKNFLYLGRGTNFPVALEGALKLKELSYIHAEGYPAAEMKHGPIALIDKNMPVLFLAMSGPTLGKVLGNVEEVKARGGKIIIVTDEKTTVVKRLSDFIIEVPKTLEELSPLINIVPLQLLACQIADMKGLNIDKPRNLAKSVTVE